MSALGRTNNGVSADSLRLVAEEAGIAPEAIERALQDALLQRRYETLRLDTGL